MNLTGASSRSSFISATSYFLSASDTTKGTVKLNGYTVTLDDSSAVSFCSGAGCIITTNEQLFAVTLEKGGTTWEVTGTDSSTSKPSAAFPYDILFSGTVKRGGAAVGSLGTQPLAPAVSRSSSPSGRTSTTSRSGTCPIEGAHPPRAALQAQEANAPGFALAA